MKIILNFINLTKYHPFVLDNRISYNKHVEVIIEKLSNLGYGIAKNDGMIIFVEKACPKDKVKIKITKRTKNYAYAAIEEIIEPSPHRVKPFCPMFNACGACQLQFIDYDFQLDLKKQIVEDAIKHIGHLDIKINSPVKSPDKYRHKIQYPTAQTKVSKRLLAGYYKPKTHELVNIKHCLIQPPICNDIIDFIRQYANEYNISGYDEKTHSGDLKHIVIRNSAAYEENLVILVLNSNKITPKIKEFAQLIYNNFKEVTGVCVNFNPKKTNVILSDNTKCLAGKDFILEKLGDKIFKIGANTFFQVNPKSAENIFKYVKEYIANNFQNAQVLDAYAGITAFGIYVSDIAQKVVSVEENTQSCELAKESLEINKINNVEINNTDAEEFLKNETKKFDVIILDPPRKGCTKETLDNAARLCKKSIIYVSCNPATLARDLKYLTDKGAKIESIQPFDMFCHTYHIENVAVISYDQNNL